jgi:hypothetical protein
MLELLFTLGAVAEARTLLEPDYGYALPARGVAQSEMGEPSTSKPWLLPRLRFDDSQDCLTFLERQIEGFGTLRIRQTCREGEEEPAPWRSL